MKIHLPAYPVGVHRIVETLSAQDLNLDPDTFNTPISAQLVLDRHDPYLQFQFNLATEVQLQCDRCLIDYQQPIEVHMPMLYVFGRSRADEAVDDPEISYMPASTVDLDISTDLRDFLILALPDKHLHDDGCKGLCTECGADWNTQTCLHQTPDLA
jgi:uncharacterized metal-binding protein YceD (DUF177 family)